MTAEVLDQTHGPDIIEGHLGGCSIGGDGGTYYPIMWKNIVDRYDVKTVLDIGCGRGYASKYFQSIGCDILGVDGSTKAEEMSLISEHFLLNDYEGGPALSRSKIEYDGKAIKDFVFDLCWCCEFVEHVWEEYAPNFIEDFKKCKYVAMTFAEPGQGGHHHVNEQPEEYWVTKLEASGFEYLVEETEEFRRFASDDKDERMKIPNVPYFIPHFINRGLLFKNKNV